MQNPAVSACFNTSIDLSDRVDMEETLVWCLKQGCHARNLKKKNIRKIIL